MIEIWIRVGEEEIGVLIEREIGVGVDDKRRKGRHKLKRQKTSKDRKCATEAKTCPICCHLSTSSGTRSDLA